jgi:hypothetical protein
MMHKCNEKVNVNYGFLGEKRHSVVYLLQNVRSSANAIEPVTD